MPLWGHTCETCGGDGECTECDGTGKRQEDDPVISFYCDECNGTGKCQTCDGTGYVDSDD